MKCLRNLLLSDLYRRWANESIRYVCIGKHIYDSSTSSGDIDILIFQSDFKKAVKIAIEMVNISPALAFHLTKSPAPFLTKTTKLLVCLEEASLPILQLDMMAAMHWRGLTYARFEDVGSQIVFKDSVPHLPDSLAVSIGALKDLLYFGSVKSKRYDSGFNPSESWELLEDAGFDIRNLKNLHEQSYRGLVRIIKQIFLLLKLKQVQGLLGFLGYIVSFVISVFPTRKKLRVLAFYGPDGAGKSTAIDLFCESEFVKEAYHSLRVKHTRPHFLPPFSWFLNPFKNESARLNGRPSRSTQTISQMKALVFAFYYSIDYILGRLVGLRFNFSRKDHLLIYDRFVLEFAYQQTFSKMPKIARRWLTLVAEQPMPGYFIYAAPHVIRIRKPELEEHEIVNQIDKFSLIDKEMKLGTEFIDSSEMRPSEVCNEILKKLRKSSQ